MSVEPPAANGQMMVTARLGHSSARAMLGIATPAASSPENWRRVSMVPPFGKLRGRFRRTLC